jgi:hypothetical protein
MKDKSGIDPLVSPSDLIRHFAVTPEGRAKFPIVERAESSNVVRLGDYRAKVASRRRPPA